MTVEWRTNGAGSEYDPLLKRLRELDASTVSDSNKALRVLSSSIRPISAQCRLVGRAVTAYAQGDLLSVLRALATAGSGDVLVVAASGAPGAVLGEIFATEAIRRGIAGIVIDGFCRDSATLRQMQLPIYACGTTPRAADARVLPQVGIPVVVGGVRIMPGDIMIGDDDGIVVGSTEEMDDIVEAAESIQRTEDALREAIKGGVSLFDRINLDQHIKNLEQGHDSSLSFGV